ncbi:hypothetical protein NDU88_008966 [Pleurodeles waltl]|uniref:Secreted protein n=1 Tax=Pleurodeles waltl TaxID=8319 RepID=A0AAV7PUJ3_PLEWA|nr:hypothetical protein NDU88_008966 [Pleurodeles waltl]
MRNMALALISGPRVLCGTHLEPMSGKELCEPSQKQVPNRCDSEGRTNLSTDTIPKQVGIIHFVTLRACFVSTFCNTWFCSLSV